MPNYWLNLFTNESWNEFLNAGANVSGFRESRWKTLQGVKPGDIFLCYLTGVSRWIGLLEATGAPFKDNSKIWSVNDFPARIPVKLVAGLEPVTAVPIVDLKQKLSIFANLKSPHAWTGRLRGSPSKWNAEDGAAVVAAVMDAVAHPVERLFDIAKLNKTPPILKSAQGKAVTIPGNDSDGAYDKSEQAIDNSNFPSAKEASGHTEMQWLLLTLGSAMGLDVWVAKNDKSKSFEGQTFASIKGLKLTLPIQFDEATTKTIELIDVIWLKGNSIQAAFEIESTTSIYSGLLRMADLITMIPNLNIPLYIVAPSERRNKVKAEVNRPTFQQLKTPMSEMCGFISFEELRQQIEKAKALLAFLKPEFLESFSESCEIEEV